MKQVPVIATTIIVVLLKDGAAREEVLHLSEQALGSRTPHLTAYPGLKAIEIEIPANEEARWIETFRMHPLVTNVHCIPAANSEQNHSRRMATSA